MKKTCIALQLTRIVMKSFFQVVFLIIAIIYGQTLHAQSKNDNVSVHVDFESARAIVRLMNMKKADTNEIARTASLPGNRQLIAKVKGYSGAGEDKFRMTLKEIIATGTIKGNDPYNWKEVKRRLPEIQQLVAYLSSNEKEFLDDVKTLIMSYVPDTLKANARACFLVGGGALGFTTGGDPTFYVALQQIGSDREGLKYLVAHELYHSLQDRGQSTRRVQPGANTPDPIRESYNLLYNLWMEGSANFVGDMLLIKNAGEFTKIQQAVLKKNEERKRENFALFDALLFRQFYDSTASYETSYNIAFTTGYDEFAYSLGFEIAKMIVKYKGPQGLATIVVNDPLLFVKQYIGLYLAHPDDKSFIRFSKSTEEIVEKLTPWIDKF
jgi:putative zinc-dependent peptidase DUF5700